MSLLKTVYKGIYDEIIIISPTFDAQYDTVWSKISSEGIKIVKDVSDDTINSVLQLTNDRETNHLVICDDIGEELRHIDQKILNMTISNSRHTRTSFVFLHQKISQSPTIVRANTDVFIVFGSNSYLEREVLWRECSVVEKRAFFEVFNQHTKNSFTFIVFSSTCGGQFKLFAMDFTKEISL